MKPKKLSEEVREVLEKLYISNPIGGISNDNGSIDHAFSDILKLFEEAIGEDRCC